MLAINLSTLESFLHLSFCFHLLPCFAGAKCYKYMVNDRGRRKHQNSSSRFNRNSFLCWIIWPGKLHFLCNRIDWSLFHFSSGFYEFNQSRFWEMQQTKKLFYSSIFVLYISSSEMILHKFVNESSNLVTMPVFHWKLLFNWMQKFTKLCKRKIQSVNNLLHGFFELHCATLTAKTYVESQNLNMKYNCSFPITTAKFRFLQSLMCQTQYCVNWNAIS